MSEHLQNLMKLGYMQRESLGVDSNAAIWYMTAAVMFTRGRQPCAKSKNVMCSIRLATQDTC